MKSWSEILIADLFEMCNRSALLDEACLRKTLAVSLGLRRS